MEREKLLQILIDNGRGDLYNELYDADTNIDEFMTKHQDDLSKMPGVTSEAPHGMSADEQDLYFAGDSDKIKKYNTDEEKYNKNLSEKSQLADEYQRRKDIDDYQHSYLGMSTDNPINKGLNWLADRIISDKTKQSIAEDPNNTARIAGNAAADIGGTGLDFATGSNPILKGIGIVGGPLVRTARDIAEGEDASDAIKQGAADLGLNAVLGGFGKKGGTEALNGDTKQAVENAGNIVTDWSKKYKEPKREFVTPISKEGEEALSKVKNKQDLINAVAAENNPELTKKLEQIYTASDKVNAKEAADKLATEYKQEFGAKMKGTNTTKQIEAAKANKLRAENPVKATVADIVNSKPGQIVGEVGGQLAKGGARTVKTQTARSPKAAEKERESKYKDALQYVIDKNKAQWDAGFKPHAVEGDILYEAYKLYQQKKNEE